MKSLGVDAVAFTGHKALMGPTGIGGLVLRTGLDIRPTRFGGTGMDSSSPVQTETYPYRLETVPSTCSGLWSFKRIRYVIKHGIENTYQNEMALLKRLREGLAELESVHMYCGKNLDNHVAVLLCNIEGMDAQDLADILDGDFHVAARSGLHCAPLVHLDIGTSPAGGVRFSPGPFNTSRDVDVVLDAMREIVTSR
jgi:selenocysteine lyase/cysteine desulfurase